MIHTLFIYIVSQVKAHKKVTITMQVKQIFFTKNCVKFVEQQQLFSNLSVLTRR